MAKFFKKPVELRRGFEVIKFEMTDGDLTELRPYRLQYTMKEACYMLNIKSEASLKKYCEDFEIPIYKFGYDDRNFISHNHLVELIQKFIDNPDLGNLIYDMYAIKQNDKDQQKD